MATPPRRWQTDAVWPDRRAIRWPLPRLEPVHYAAGDEAGYRRTLARGLRMVDAGAAPRGALAAGSRSRRLLFERGDSRRLTVTGRWPRQHLPHRHALPRSTIRPISPCARLYSAAALVGVISVVIHTVAALAPIEPGWAIPVSGATPAKQAGHAPIMAVFLCGVVGRLGVRRGGFPTWRCRRCDGARSSTLRRHWLRRGCPVGHALRWSCWPVALALPPMRHCWRPQIA